MIEVQMFDKPWLQICMLGQCHKIQLIQFKSVSFLKKKKKKNLVEIHVNKWSANC